MTKPDTVEVTYNAIGLRESITELHGTTVITAKTFVWAGLKLSQERDVTGHTVTKQFFSQGEQINGVNYYFSFDHSGSVRQMTDSNGLVHADYDYDAFGRQTKLSGDLDSDFGYTGSYIEKSVCLDLTWFRAYDPEKGRWLSRDPFGEFKNDAIDNNFIDSNLYTYALNNPLSNVDYLGLDSVDINPDSRMYSGDCRNALLNLALNFAKVVGKKDPTSEAEYLALVKILAEVTYRCREKITCTKLGQVLDDIIKMIDDAGGRGMLMIIPMNVLTNPSCNKNGA